MEEMTEKRQEAEDLMAKNMAEFSEILAMLVDASYMYLYLKFVASALESLDRDFFHEFRQHRDIERKFGDWLQELKGKIKERQLAKEPTVQDEKEAFEKEAKEEEQNFEAGDSTRDQEDVTQSLCNGLSKLDLEDNSMPQHEEVEDAEEKKEKPDEEDLEWRFPERCRP